MKNLILLKNTIVQSYAFYCIGIILIKLSVINLMFFKILIKKPLNHMKLFNVEIN